MCVVCALQLHYTKHLDIFPFSLSACPTERQLRYHIAAKLGQHWRSVGSYLGLQHWQLEQALYADSKFEEQAMQALVMWLSGQGDSDKPRSWMTVLEALRLAGQNDMAAKLEEEIREDRLSPSQQCKSTHFLQSEQCYSSIHPHVWRF